MNDLFDSPSTTLRWLEMPEGKAFMDYISMLLDSSRKRLEKENDLVDLYRLQGKIEAFKTVANLPDEMKELIKRKVAS